MRIRTSMISGQVAALLGLILASLLVVLPAMHQHAAAAPASPATSCTLCVVFSSVEPSGPGPSSTASLDVTNMPAPSAGHGPVQVFLETADGRAPPAGRQTPSVS